MARTATVRVPIALHRLLAAACGYFGWEIGEQVEAVIRPWAEAEHARWTAARASGIRSPAPSRDVVGPTVGVRVSADLARILVEIPKLAGGPTTAAMIGQRLGRWVRAQAAAAAVAIRRDTGQQWDQVAAAWEQPLSRSDRRKGWPDRRG
jgi:hypothetical protein